MNCSSISVRVSGRLVGDELEIVSLTPAAR